jgi:hypothetical protein
MSSALLGKFTVPMELGLSEARLGLIKSRLRTGFVRSAWTLAVLNWYMNYCCRDDYGATTNNTSAWAGIQYFASREPEEKGPL